MNEKDALGNRMKRYESVTQNHLIRRTPVIIRLDGKAFHSFKYKLPDSTPFSDIMHSCMAETMKYMVEEIQGARFGYTQSDEISILLNDWNTLNTDSWFDNNIQKIVSVSAAMAAQYFNWCLSMSVFNGNNPFPWQRNHALFDSRVFNLAKEEVDNYFVWRQKDCITNSVSMLAQHYFSPKQLHGVSQADMKIMLFDGNFCDWGSIEEWKKYGTIVHRGEDFQSAPIFKDNRLVINAHLVDEHGVIF